MHKNHINVNKTTENLKKKKPLTAGLTVADTTDKILMPRDRTIAL